MSPTALAHVTELLTQIDRLRTQHRAGETPTFGQVEALFDQAAAVREALAPCPAVWPTAAAAPVAVPAGLLDQAAQHITTALALVSAHGYANRPTGAGR